MSGYIGNIPVPQATQTRDVFTATSGQTSFATSGYTPGYLDVWLNGVKLVNGTDFTATNGSDVVLSSGAATSDIVEVLSYSTYEVNAQTYTGGLTAKNDGAAAIAANRLNSDGPVLNVQRDGSTLGTLGVFANEFYAGSAIGSDTFMRYGYSGIVPATATGSNRDNAIDLGSSVARFKNLYLSGGVYLGGTGNENLLDDYEEGTWTPGIRGAGTPGTYSLSSAAATYRKIGSLVIASMRLVGINGSGGSNYMQITGLPFFKANNGILSDSAVRLRYASGTFDYPTLEMITGGSTNVAYIFCNQHNSGGFDLPIANVGPSTEISGHLIYFSETP